MRNSKTQHQNILNRDRINKKHNDSSTLSTVAGKNKKLRERERERERIIIFSWENVKWNNKFKENKMRIRRVK